MGITIAELSPDNPDALAHLAWHELVEEAEKTLPILVLGTARFSSMVKFGHIWRSYLVTKALEELQ